MSYVFVDNVVDHNESTDDDKNKIRNFFIKEHSKSKFKGTLTDEIMDIKMNYIGYADKYFALKEMNYDKFINNLNYVRTCNDVIIGKPDELYTHIFSPVFYRGEVLRNVRILKNIVYNMKCINIIIGRNRIDTINSSIFDTLNVLLSNSDINSDINSNINSDVNNDYVIIPSSIIMDGLPFLDDHEITFEITADKDLNNLLNNNPLCIYDIYKHHEIYQLYPYPLHSLHGVNYQIQNTGKEHVTINDEVNACNLNLNHRLNFNHVCKYLIVSISKCDFIKLDDEIMKNITIYINKSSYINLPLIYSEINDKNYIFTYDFFNLNLSCIDHVTVEKNIPMISNISSILKKNFTINYYAVNMSAFICKYGRFGLLFSK